MSSFTLCHPFTSHKGKNLENPRVVYDYSKNGNWNNPGSKITGMCVFVNASDYACIDIDVKNKIDSSEILELFMNALNPHDINVKIETTTSGGFHIWCKWDKSLTPKSGRETKIYSEPEFYDVDLFTPLNENVPNLVIVSPSEAKGHDGVIGKYEMKRDCDDSILSNLCEVVQLLESNCLVNFERVKTVIKPKTIQNQTQCNNSVEISTRRAVSLSQQDQDCKAELFELLKKGVEGLNVHLHKDRQNIESEPTIWALFKGAYGCVGNEVSVEEVDEWLNTFRDEHEDLLTESARKNWTAERKRYKAENNKSCGLLVQLIKYHNKEFWENELKAYYTKQTKENVNTFDIYDSFDIESIEDTNYSLNFDVERVGGVDDENEKVDYKRLNADIMKIIRVIRTDGQLRFIYKDKCSVKQGQSEHRIRFLDETAAQKLFSSVSLVGLPKEKKSGKMRYPNLYEYIMNTIKRYRVKRCSFYKSEDSETFILFAGLPWKAYTMSEMNDDEVNELIKLHLAHWKNQFCSGSEEQFNYFVNWNARICQIPNCKNRTTLALISKQGTGKNRYYTDEMQTLLTNDYSYYTTNIKNVFGDFNSPIEYKKLVIMDETADSDKNCSSGYTFNYDRFKGTCTAEYLDINEKNKPQRIAENVFNGVILSNNAQPFKIQDSDRRMVLFDVSNEYANVPDTKEARENPQLIAQKHKRDDYFNALENERSNPKFFRALFTYLMRRDISKFEPERDRPLTKKKEEMLENSKTPIIMFIEEYIKTIDEGNWKTTDAYDCYKLFAERFGYGRYCKAIQSFICELKSLGINSVRHTRDKIKSSYLELTEEAKTRFNNIEEEEE